MDENCEAFVHQTIDSLDLRRLAAEASSFFFSFLFVRHDNEVVL